jgi:hypothetical protein
MRTLCSKLFNSIYNKQKQKTRLNILLQHFIGWFIKSEQAVFNMNKKRLWIFGGTKEIPFMCCLPQKPSFTGIHFVFAPAFKKKE